MKQNKYFVIATATPSDSPNSHNLRSNNNYPRRNYNENYCEHAIRHRKP